MVTISLPEYNRLKKIEDEILNELGKSFKDKKTLLCIDYLRGPFGVRIHQYWVANETDILIELNEQLIKQVKEIRQLQLEESRLEKYLAMPWYKRIFI